MKNIAQARQQVWLYYGTKLLHFLWYCWTCGCYQM